MRTTFAVGRLTPRSAEIVLLDTSEKRDPFPGPWKLQALVTRLRDRDVHRVKANSRVH
ncbi:MAG: hypothetical protein R3223_02920 [Longimicrobiales bacterium]|nr:hypothetical protein [Longimicrobiales bacterium]